MEAVVLRPEHLVDVPIGTIHGCETANAGSPATGTNTGLELRRFRTRSGLSPGRGRGCPEC
jgi:hypothetical protein